MSSRIILLLVALSLAFAPVAEAPTKSTQRTRPLAEAAPAKAGMSAERLARIDSMIETAIKEE